MNESKVTFTGNLDLAARQLELVVPLITDLWNGGEYRMQMQRIKQIEEYLDRTRKADKEIRSVLRLFKEIAATPNAGAKIETEMERMGLIPAKLLEVAASTTL